jgi:hypothetical protein
VLAQLAHERGGSAAATVEHDNGVVPDELNIRKASRRPSSTSALSLTTVAFEGSELLFAPPALSLASVSHVAREAVRSGEVPQGVDLENRESMRGLGNRSGEEDGYDKWGLYVSE